MRQIERAVRWSAIMAMLISVVFMAQSASASASSKIVGGEPTTHAWPAQARVGIGASSFCGGTLVAPRWVLTAAHCVADGDGGVLAPSEFLVTLGSGKLNGEGGTNHAVSQVAMNPSYKESTFENDAALLRLSTASQQAPMALISNDSLSLAAPGLSARVLGWGDTTQGGSPSPVLLQADVPIVDDFTCGSPSSYGSRLFPAVMLCAGLAAGGMDSCQGDSGGPLLVYTGIGANTSSPPSTEGWKQAGIVSWGDGCAQPNKYGIYTELGNASIRAWVHQTISGLPLGLQNPSFEQPLSSASNWAATVYDSGGNVVRSGSNACPSGLSEAEAQRRICRVGTDSFQVIDSGVSKDIVVSPLDGDSMLRLGGPFHVSGEGQAMDRYVASQSFVVDSANSLLHLNYNMFTFDYTNFDELRLRVRLFDTGGDVVYNKVIGSFGPSGDVSFKSTGWRSANIDLSSLVGEEVTLRLDSGGTQDNLFGFWAYIDAGTVPEVVSHPGPPEVATETPAGGPVIYQVQEDANGLAYYNFAASSVNAFTAVGQCLSLRLPVPIEPGASTVSNVSLLLNQSSGGSQQVPLEDPDADNVWTVPAASNGICVQKGTLYVTFTLTENGVSQDFVVPLGGITLIDPQGVVYDKERFEANIAAGMAPDAARADAALGGVTATLQREVVGGGFQTVLSGDPGISPNVNPEITPSSGPSKGLFQWDVAAGNYRVAVSLTGYLDTVSPVVTIPPEVTDLHIAMQPLPSPASPVVPPLLSGGVQPQPQPLPLPGPAPAATSALRRQEGQGAEALPVPAKTPGGAEAMQNAHQQREEGQMHQESEGARQESRLSGAGRSRGAAVLGAAATLLASVGLGCGAEAPQPQAEAEVELTISFGARRG